MKSAVNFISKFEETAIDIAARNNYDYVVCGHIHQPNIETHQVQGKKVMYLNSGDWIENLTALEYNDKKWSIYHYHEDINVTTEKVELNEKSNANLFEEMLEEFNQIKNV